MASSTLKKKKARAALRNEARHMANRIETDAGTAEESKARAKPAAPAPDELDLGKPAKFVEARHAEVGYKLVNWNRRWVVEFTGEVRRKSTWLDLHPDSVPGEQVEYMFTGYDMLGNRTAAFGFAPYYPLRDDSTDVARIMERFLYKQALEERKMGKAAEKRAATREAGQDGEVDETGEPSAPRRARAPRGELDPKTGCTPGSDGHKFGEIMLSVKAGADHRKESVAAITALLKERMDESKARALGQSWYSTLKRKKPEIYGKLGDA